MAYQNVNGAVDFCVGGCLCPDDMRMNYEGICVKEEKCECTYEEKTYEPNSLIELQDGSIKKCTSGIWLDQPNGSKLPTCGENMVWSPCLSDTEPTCDNLHRLISESKHCKQGNFNGSDKDTTCKS